MKMNKIGFAIFLIAALILAVSVVYAQPVENFSRISNVNLNGQGDYLEVDPGETIELSFDYEIWSPKIGLTFTLRQIVIGLNREPLYCAYSGNPYKLPDTTKGQSRFTMTAPTEPGTYRVRCVDVTTNICDDAKDMYRESDYLGYTIGTIKVTEPDKLGICARVYNVNLNNQGNYLEVCTNEAFTVDLDYDIWCWVAGNSRRQIIVGIDDDPFWCVYDGVPPELPGLSRHDSVTIAIPKPGTYTLSWMITFCDNVGDAGDRYRSRPDLREKIGTIKVTDCSGGIYDRYCEVFAISLNGQDNLEIGPGGLVRITVYYELWNADTCPECTQQIVIGLDDNPMYCAYDGVPGIHPGIYDHDQVFYEMTAPTTPGIYNIMWTSTSGCTCAEAKNLYRTGPNFRKKIATIKVIGDEDWKRIHYKTFPEGPLESTNISFYQRGNDLLVQINDTDFYGIRSGSVSISVDESIDVFYYTSNVSGLHLWETNYKNITRPEMTSEERAALFIAGLLGGTTGKALGIAQYAKDTIPDEIDWYAEKNSTGDDIIVRSKMYFEWYDILNWRDNVIIPWYIGPLHTPVKSIRVKCPEMHFPKTGIYNIVFRVDYTIGWHEVRYDVALPITVT